MIPAGGTDSQAAITVEQPSHTWRLDVERGKIVGMIDGLEAVRQAVMKIVHTERFRHLIYDADYGIELVKLIGREPVLVRSELRRRIREALLPDDRITDVVDFQIDIIGDVATVECTVVTTMGNFVQEVSLHV